MRKLPARPVIFGLSDGSMSILGVVFYASGHGSLVFPVAFSGGVSAACSMAGGEWLSESRNGLGASAAMGLATLAGSLLPAFPYLFLRHWEAPALSVVMLIAVAFVVGRLRRGQNYPYTGTFAVLGVVLAASVACALLIPGGAG